MERKYALELILGALLATLVGCLAPPSDPTPTAVTASPVTYGNLPMRTLGGKQLWADELWESGWRIQRNLVTGHHRLLGPDDVRHAWGNYAGCAARLDRFREAGQVTPAARHVVVCLHGIWRSKDSLGGLTREMREAGYQVADLNYPSALWGIEGCAVQVERVLHRLPDAVERISFVTHSMGGLVVRRLLGSDSQGSSWREHRRVECCVMLFPPNRGAHLANAWHDTWLYELAMGPAGQELTSGSASDLPVPDLPIGIIAGGRGDGRGRSLLIPGDDDGTVAVRETELAGADRVVLDVGHTFGMNDERTVAAVLAFLEHGAF